MRCLLVDDEAGIREGLATLLRLRGHDVQTAADCTSAIALLTTRAFDFVLSDWRLPDGTGERLYAHGQAPIVAISGHVEEVTPSPRLHAVLQKPVPIPRLLSLLAERANALAPAVPAPHTKALPGDVAAVLLRARNALGGAECEITDDGTFVTLCAAVPDANARAMLRELGGDLQELRADPARIRLRWCRDGRPAADCRVVRADEPWPICTEFAVDCEGARLTLEQQHELLGAAIAARAAGRQVWLLNPPLSLAHMVTANPAATAAVRPARIGPTLEGVLAELWS